MSQGQNGSAELLQLADRMLGPKSRFDEIYLAVALLFEQQAEAFNVRERELAADILRRVSRDVEMSIRLSLAERLADDPKAPHELIVLLVDDRIEVARPILIRSAALSDTDMVRVIERGSPDHQIAIAERKRINELISSALVRSACEGAIIALLRNGTAKIASDTFRQLGERARNAPELQEPLVQRHDLPPDLAPRLYLWVSQALKSALTARYPNIAETVALAIDQTSAMLQSGEEPVAEVNAKKLVEKLHASGQLRASFLVRVLNQGQMELFDHAFAKLLGMEIETMRKALYGEDPLTVALACRAVGIDRSVFLTVFNLSRQQRRVPVKLSEADQKQIGVIFNEVQKTEALQKLKAQAA